MKRLAKSKLKDLLKRWAEKYRVLAPGRGCGGDILLDDFDEGSFTLEYGKTPSLPKSLIFPQSEVLFAVEGGEFREVLPAGPAVLFGIRPCDLMGLCQSASFMNRDRRDPYCGARRDAVLTAVMACPGPQNETCFCATMESGPVARDGFDLQFFDAGEGFLIDAGSAQGEALLAMLPPAELDDGGAREGVEEFRQAASAAIAHADAVWKAMGRLKDRSVRDGVWERFGEKCIQCGGCAFVCPTCTCFNVYDLTAAPGQGIRARSWDACLFAGFTREASGHNPRSSQALRLKRRHEHKLLDYHEADLRGGLSGCTGCGRCSDFCPVHIGTLEVARAIVEDHPGPE